METEVHPNGKLTLVLGADGEPIMKGFYGLVQDEAGVKFWWCPAINDICGVAVTDGLRSNGRG